MARRRPVEIDACVVCREGSRTFGLVSGPVRWATISLAEHFGRQAEAKVICSRCIRALLRTTTFFPAQTYLRSSVNTASN